MSETKHGMIAYFSKKCRCDVCREDANAYARKRRKERHAWVRANGLPRSIAHGYSAYKNWGCRCKICVEANSANYRRRAQRREDQRTLTLAQRA